MGFPVQSGKITIFEHLLACCKDLRATLVERDDADIKAVELYSELK